MIDITQEGFARAPDEVKDALGLWCSVCFPDTDVAGLYVDDDGLGGSIKGRVKNPAMRQTNELLWVQVDRFMLRVPQLVLRHFRQN